jgi:hypothetical protein
LGSGSGAPSRLGVAAICFVMGRCRSSTVGGPKHASGVAPALPIYLYACTNRHPRAPADQSTTRMVLGPVIKLVTKNAKRKPARGTYCCPNEHVHPPPTPLPRDNSRDLGRPCRSSCCLDGMACASVSGSLASFGAGRGRISVSCACASVLPSLTFPLAIYLPFPVTRSRTHYSAVVRRRKKSSSNVWQTGVLGLSSLWSPWISTSNALSCPQCGYQRRTVVSSLLCEEHLSAGGIRQRARGAVPHHDMASA